MHTYTRETLIDICERAVVDVSKWHDRDSPSTQEKVGQCWALLKAGCNYEVRCDKEKHGDCTTDDETIWINVFYPSFMSIECGESENDEIFYLPTEKRLRRVAGKDWY